MTRTTRILAAALLAAPALAGAQIEDEAQAAAPAAPAAKQPTQREELERIIQRQRPRQRARGHRRREPRRSAGDGRARSSRTARSRRRPEYAGLAHMYEHMFFKSNDDYPQPDQFSSRASELGAVFNGRTREESVNYYLTFPPIRLQGGMRFHRGRVPRAALPPDELERETPGGDRRVRPPGVEPVLPAHAEDGQRNVAGRSRRGRTRSATASVIVDGHAGADARDPASLLHPEQRRADHHRRRRSRDVPSRWRDAIFGELPAGDDPFVKYPIPRLPAAHGKSAAVIVEEPVNTVAVLVQWQGPSVRNGSARPRTRPTSSAMLLNQDGSNFQKRLVDSGLLSAMVRELLHAQPRRARSRSAARRRRQAEAALAALYQEIAQVRPAGVCVGGRAGRRQGSSGR